MIVAADKVLALAGANTKIIPGHGPLATKPKADHDARLGTGFMKPDVWVGLVYDSLP